MLLVCVTTLPQFPILCECLDCVNVGLLPIWLSHPNEGKNVNDEDHMSRILIK